jgi:hypothetical protein
MGSAGQPGYAPLPPFSNLPTYSSHTFSSSTCSSDNSSKRSGASDPHPVGCKALQNVKDGEDPVYRVRSGDYRVLYVVRNPDVVILDVDHRKDVYR